MAEPRILGIVLAVRAARGIAAARGFHRERIAAVSSADVLAAARRYLKPEAFKLVVIGNSEQFDKPLSSFGTVKELDLTTHKEPGR